jgi:hypothetical protein
MIQAPTVGNANAEPSTTSFLGISPAELVRFLQGCRLDLSTEKNLQVDLQHALTAAGIPFEREKRLSDRDIPDFFVQGGIVVECKMRKKSRKIDIFKQITRYATHAEVSAIILASNVSMGLPDQIEGKPVFSASLSRGWL